ncbi:hypothetical protein [Streptomyces sp. A1136]|uniref:hypothetical protein n=1 Tax=Streptomyces sp. A1136 TaxID=2563102 RepID=UPI00109EA194|nr:hypothetical protein [Streptomyces sp. A1136]THA56147.1 hypothetical protein E6R62_12445 [Streptomyces sp. A1136]
MSDSDSTHQVHPRPVQAEVVVSKDVPDGRAMIPVHCKGKLVLALHPDHASEQLARELANHFAHATRVGLAALYAPIEEARPRPEV